MNMIRASEAKEQTDRRNFLNAILSSMPQARFNNDFQSFTGVTSPENFLGFRSYQDFINAQTNIVNGFNQESLRTLQTLLNNIVPISSYLDKGDRTARQITGLVLNSEGRIVFV